MRLRRRIITSIWGFALGLVAAVVTIAWSEVGARRAAAIDMAAAHARQLAAGAERTLNRTLLGFDALLASLPMQVALAQRGDGQLDAKAAGRMLATAADRNLLLRDLALLSPDGKVLAAARPLASGLDLAVDVAVIAQAQARRPAGLVVGAPIIDGASSERTVVLARSVVLDHRAAIAVALVPASQLAGVIAPVGDAADLAVTLERDDGMLLASAPPMEALIGRILPAGPLPAAALSGQAQRSVGRLAPGPALVAARPLLHPTLRVTVAAPIGPLVGPWPDRLGDVLGVTAAFTALILAAAAAIHWQFARLSRAKAEAALSIAALDRALHAITDGFLLCDADDRIVAWNERYLELHPWLRPVVGQGVPFEALLDAAAKAVLPKASPAEQAAWRIQRRMRHRSGNVDFEQVLVNGEVIHVTERRTPDDGIVSVFRDVTRAERELRKAKSAAEAANEAKSRFLAAMSHEIRTPLNGVLGMNRMLMRSTLSPEQQRCTRTIEASGRTLLALIDDILDLSRIEAGHMELEATDFEPRTLVEEVVASLAPRALEKGLALHMHWPDDPVPRLRGDANRLRQVLFNLLGNALKFTHVGLVDLDVTTQDLSGGRLGLRLTVRDTGIGMPSETVARLFERFVQADSSTARRYGGSGLGLAITREIVNLMGGQIDVDSLPERGSVFIVSIPFERGAPLPQGDTDGRQSPHKSLRLLVAEDNDVNQIVIQATLREMGHDCVIVDDGRQAIDRASEGGWDCVLMDIQMPGMDGEEAAQGIRALPGPAGQVPIIALTANAMLDDYRRYIAAGMNDHVAKPVDPERLAQALAACLACPQPAALAS